MPRRFRFLLFISMPVLITGCAVEPVMSAMHPAGPAASKIAWLAWLMTACFTAVFCLVVVLSLYSVLRKRSVESSPPLGNNGFVVAGGVALPVLVLLPLFLFSLETSSALQRPKNARTIRVVGRMWWWEIQYPDQGVITANEIHIPVGQPILLELTSTDVIHSFWVPRLNGKMDLVPGRKNMFWIQADEPGRFRGQCAEYCGVQHAKMGFEVVAEPPKKFDEWLAERRQPRADPVGEQRQHGKNVFFKSGCAHCHAIRGTTAVGTAGPDLTHVGSRQMLAAATIPNTSAHLRGWIANPQAIKPGNKMPRTFVSADELMDLVAYLESLK